jgi:hypothetical protein
MENWGMMAFSEAFLLVNGNTPFPRKQRIARLVCHEVAHQWFGNLATMSVSKENSKKILRKLVVEIFMAKRRIGPLLGIQHDRHLLSR